MAADSKIATSDRLKPYRFKVGQFDRMIAAGIFGERARIELRNGLLAVKSGVSQSRIFKTRSGLPIYKVSGRQINAMLERGILREGTHAELLGGVLIKQMTKYPPHNFVVSYVSALLRDLVPPSWLVFEEKPVLIAHFWLPEPDIALIRGPFDRFRDKNPTEKDVALFVEVAESSYRDDRRVKWRKYAAAGIPVYWIVNLNERRVEVFTEQQGAGKAAKYLKEDYFGPEAEVPVVLEGKEIGRIQVGSILPRTNRPEETSKE